MTFWKPLKNLYDKSLKNLARSLNMIKDQKFSLRIFHLKTVLMTGRKRFPQLYQVFLATSQRICWFSETVKKIHSFLRVSIFLQNVSVKHGKQFWQPRRNFSNIKPNFLSSNFRRRYEKHKFFKTLKNGCMDTKRAVLTKPPKKFQQVAKFFQFKIMKW